MKAKVRIKNTLNVPSIIFKLISTWLTLSFINFLQYKYTNILAFGQDKSITVILGTFTLIFIGILALEIIINKKDFTYYLAFFLGIINSFIWMSRNDNIFFTILIFLFFLLMYKYKPNNLDFTSYFENKNIKLPIIMFSIIMFLVIAISGILRYKTFGSPNFDLGIPTQNFYYLKKYLIPLSTCERNILMSHFKIHVSLIYYLVLPLYCIYSSAITLQIASALLITSGIIPLYLIVKNHKLSNYLTLLICTIYTIYAPAICSTFFDFHENIFLTPLLLWFFYAYEKNNNPLFFLMMFLIFIVKEDAPIYTAIFGVYMIADKDAKKGILTILYSITYFILATSYINTYGAGIMAERYNNLIFNNSGLIGIIKTFIINPEYFLKQLITVNDSYNKVIYIIQLFLPLGFIPCVSKKWKNYLLLLPLLLTTMTTYTYSYDITFHYSCGIIAFLLYLFILNISDKKKTSYIAICLIGAILIYANYVTPDLNNKINIYNFRKEGLKEKEALLKTIPENASVNATAFILPHIANRDIIYETFYHKNQTDVDYVVLDLGSEQDRNSYLEYINNNYYEYQNLDNSMVILKKAN